MSESEETYEVKASIKKVSGASVMAFSAPGVEISVSFLDSDEAVETMVNMVHDLPEFATQLITEANAEIGESEEES